MLAMSLRGGRLWVATIAGLAAIAAITLVVLDVVDDDTETAASTSTSSSSSSSTSSTTSTTAAAACADAPPPESDADRQTATADVDGDGEADEVTTYRVGETEWHFAVQLAAGGGHDLVMPNAGAGGVTLIGGADIDGDGSHELWAKVDSGASAEILGLFAFADCEVRTVDLDEAPATFPVGGSVGSSAGLDCAAPGIVVFSASSNDGQTYETTSTSYRLEAGELSFVGADAGTVDVGDPGFDRYSSFSCKGLTL